MSLSKAEQVERKLAEHMRQDERMFDAIVEDIRLINETKLPQIQSTLAGIEANLNWIKLGLLAVLGGIITSFFTK